MAASAAAELPAQLTQTAKALFRSLAAPMRSVNRMYAAPQLKALGIVYEDLLHDDEPDHITALSRIPKEEADLRMKRLIRAVDLSTKRKTLPEDLQDYDAFRSYLQEHIDLAKQEREERELLNHYM